jgi:uncharacterized protein YkwD
MNRLLVFALFVIVARPAAGGGASDTSAFVDAHNAVRAKHCAPPLKASPKVEASAKAWAKKLQGQGCALQHSGGQYGENLAGGTAGTLDAQSVVAMWYGEGAHYDFKRGKFSMKTGHFTQVVWRGTTEVGCARAACGGVDVFVCQYAPPGNVEGQYLDNVKPTACR